MVSESVAPLPRVTLEYVDLRAVGLDVEEPDADHPIALCARVLGGAVPDPGGCQLVVTGDFVRSVRDRSDEAYGGTYELERSTGLVGGKTIRTEAGVDVLVHAAFFAPDVPAPAAALRVGVRTVVHEAQHAAMAQAGEAAQHPPTLESARVAFLGMADMIIEEYRAECGARELMSDSQGWDIQELLENWHQDLIRIACVEYQEHLEVDRLVFHVCQESQTVWKLLAYLAAEVRDGVATTADVSTDPLWRLMVEPHWPEFTETLALVPSGRVRTDRGNIEVAVRQLAPVLDRWLQTLGFTYADDGERSRFDVTDWSVLFWPETAE